MQKLTQEPLLHFLLIGAVLFAIYQALNPGEDHYDPRTIVVDENRLLNHMQYRSRAFDPERYRATFANLSDIERARLIEDFVREEALYREAKALQLDQNDYVARLRLIQQLEFLLRGFVDTELPLTEADVRRYWDTHREAYREPARITFTHVFFSARTRGDKDSRQLAGEQLERLNGSKVPFERAPSYGDRFPYHLNYVERAEDMVASHLGDAMAQQLFEIEPREGVWRGPFKSPHGYHLVMLTRRIEAQAPELEDVRHRVLPDARQFILNERMEALKDAIVDEYRIKAVGLDTVVSGEWGS